MGPKRAENAGKTTRLAQNLAGAANLTAGGTINEQGGRHISFPIA